MVDHQQENTAEASAQDSVDGMAEEQTEAVETMPTANEYDDTAETDGTLSPAQRLRLEGEFPVRGISRMESDKAAGYTPPLTRAHFHPSPELIRSAALGIAAQGFPIFPCNPTGERAKQPITKQGFKDATLDPGRIWRWWTQWKSALIGLRTGRAGGVFVVDLDNKNGVDGVAELEKLEAKHGKLSETYTVITPSGGKHLYFAMPDINLGCSASRVGPGIDIRAEGGYVIAPPSIVGDGGAYEAVDNGFTMAELAAAPQWLIKLVH